MLHKNVRAVVFVFRAVNPTRATRASARVFFFFFSFTRRIPQRTLNGPGATISKSAAACTLPAVSDTRIRKSLSSLQLVVWNVSVSGLLDFPYKTKVISLLLQGNTRFSLFGSSLFHPKLRQITLVFISRDGPSILPLKPR